MVNYHEEIKLLAKRIKESMQEKVIKEENSEKEKAKEEQDFFKKNNPLMIKVMKPLAKALIQKNKKISDVNKKIKFSLPSKTFQRCEISIPFGLYFKISLDYERQLFILEIIKYKNYRNIELSSSKRCGLNEDELESAVSELFLKYIRENLL